MDQMREPDATWQPPAQQEDLSALEARCDCLQTLIGELLLKNQELRLRLAQLETSADAGSAF